MSEGLFYIPMVLAGLSAIALLLSNIIFSFAYKKYDFDENLIVQEINDNMEGHLITSFTPTYGSCNPDEEILILGHWKGSLEGCYCNDDDIKEKKCSEDQKECSTIGGSKGQDYTKINSRIICVKKSKETYKELLEKGMIVSKESNCPKNYISCGTIDTSGNIYCAESDDKCPIHMSDITDNLNQFLNDYPLGYNNIKAQDDNNIISIFKLSETLPCINPEEKSWNTTYTLDIKDSCRTKIKGKVNDDRYEKTELSTTRNVLYKENNIPMPIDEINEDIDKDKTPIYLYGRRFLGFEKEDIDHFKYDKLISYQKLPNTCNSVMRIISIIIFVCLGLPFLALFGICCGGASGGNVNCDDKGCACFLITWGVSIVVSIALGFLIDLILCLIIFARTLKIREILNFDFSDEYTNGLFEILMNEYKRNYNYSLSGLILTCLTAFFGISIPITYVITNC